MNHNKIIIKLCFRGNEPVLRRCDNVLNVYFLSLTGVLNTTSSFRDMTVLLYFRFILYKITIGSDWIQSRSQVAFIGRSICCLYKS